MEARKNKSSRLLSAQDVEMFRVECTIFFSGCLLVGISYASAPLVLKKKFEMRKYRVLVLNTINSQWFREGILKPLENSLSNAIMQKREFFKKKIENSTNKNKEIWHIVSTDKVLRKIRNHLI